MSESHTFYASLLGIKKISSSTSSNLICERQDNPTFFETAINNTIIREKTDINQWHDAFRAKAKRTEKRGKVLKAGSQVHPEDVFCYLFFTIMWILLLFLLKSWQNLPLFCSSFLLTVSPNESITECSRVPLLKDENVWLWLHGKAIKVRMCLTCQFITVIIESWQGKERN